MFGLLARHARKEVIECCEASGSQRDMLRGGGAPEAFEKLGDTGLGDVVLLDAGFDCIDILDFGVEVDVVASQDGHQVCDLVVGKLFGHGARWESESPAVRGALVLELFLLRKVWKPVVRAVG